MALSEDDAAALRADLERLQQEKGAAEAANREYEAKLERFWKERSMAYPSTGKVVVVQLIVGELLLRLWVPCGRVGRVSAVVWGKVCRMFLGVLYQNSPRNALPTSTSLRSDVLRSS